MQSGYGGHCGLEDYKRILEGFVTRLVESKTAVLLMTPNALVWTTSRKKHEASLYGGDGEWSFDAPMEAYCAAMWVLAKKHALPLLDVHALYRGKGHAWTDAMLLDGVHPDDVGHDWLAKRLAYKIVEVGLHKRLPRVNRLPVPAIACALPFFDLSGAAGRQVIVDREKGQYLGHVTTALMPDGKTMLCTYPKGHGKGAIVMKRSTDGGRTWSSRLPLPESFATSKEVPTLFHTVDAKGQKRLLLFSGLYPIRLAHSEDEGGTWSELEPIGEFGGIVAMGSMVALASPGQYRIRLMHNFHAWDCAYPGLERLPDGTIVTTTYGHWSSGEPPYIVSVRLRIDEIDARWKARQEADPGAGR